MNIFKKALIVALSVGLISVPSVTKEVEAAGNSKCIYFQPDSNWSQANARFSIYQWGDSLDWYSMKSITIDGTKYHYGELSLKSTGYKFVRFDSNNTTNSWDSKWNESGDLNISKVNGKNITDNNTFVKTNDWWNSWTDTDGAQYKSVHAYNINYYDGNEIVFTERVLDPICNNYSISKSLEDKEGFTFAGWSTEENGSKITSYTGDVNADVSLYALWESSEITKYDVTFNYADSTKTISVDAGSNLSDVLPDTGNISVVSWDKSGTVTSNMEVNATEYYTKIEKVDIQLAMDYIYTTSNIWLEYYKEDGAELPKLYAKNSTTNEEVSFEMLWVKNMSDGKTLCYANVPLQYDKIKFTFRSNEGDESKRNVDTGFLDRNYTNNASWYNWSEGFGFFSYESKYSRDIQEVANVSLRFTTSNLPKTGFLGVTEYGIRIAKGNTISDEWYYGPNWSASEISEENNSIVWSAIINNISNYEQEFTAVPWVKIGEKKYDLCSPRTVSVVSASQEYLDKAEKSEIELSAKQKSVLSYIVDSRA